MLFRNSLNSKINNSVWWNIVSLGVLAISGITINLLIITFRGEKALGIFNQVYAIYIVLSQIGVFGLQASVLQQVSYTPNKKDLCSAITLSALISVTLTATMVSIIGWQLAKPIGVLLDSPDVSLGLILSLPGLVLFCMNKILLNVLNGLQSMKAYSIFKSLRFIFIPIAMGGVVQKNLADPYLLLSLTITEIVLFLGLTAFIFGYKLPLKICSNFRIYLAKHLAFGIRGVFGGILVELNTRVDILMLGYFTSDLNVGIYSLAATLAEGFSQIPYAIRWSIDPIIGKHFAQNETSKISQLAKNVRRSYHPLTVLLGILAVSAYPIFIKFFSPDYVFLSWVVFTIIMIGAIVNAGYRPFTGIFLQGGKPTLNTLFVLGLVLNDALLNLIFIPLLGIIGAAIVTTITYVLEALFLIAIVRKEFKIHL